MVAGLFQVDRGPARRKPLPPGRRLPHVHQLLQRGREGHSGRRFGHDKPAALFAAGRHDRSGQKRPVDRLVAGRRHQYLPDREGRRLAAAAVAGSFQQRDRVANPDERSPDLHRMQPAHLRGRRVVAEQRPPATDRIHSGCAAAQSASRAIGRAVSPVCREQRRLRRILRQ